MEDLFALDDAEVEVVPRTRPSQSISPVPDHVTRHVSSRSMEPQVGAPDEDLSFDYLPARSRARSPTHEPFNLGLDEEVIVSHRAPQAKLDDERLLGPSGIPKIRDEVSKKFRFRGKGCELQDLDRFIEHYQFWAHELFPKAKFRDALKIINKVGKTKSMKSRRRQIINDMLPKPLVAEEDIDNSGDEPEPTMTNPQTLQNQIVQQSQNLESEQEFGLSDLESLPDMGQSGNPIQGLQGIANDIPDEMPMEEDDNLDDMDALEAMRTMS